MTSSFTEIPVNCSIKEGDKGRFQLLWKKKSQMWFFFPPSLQFLRNLLDVLGTRRRQSVLNNLGRLRTIGKRAKKHAEWGDKCRTARASRDGGRGWPWDENSENEVHEPNPGAGCMSDRLEGGHMMEKLCEEERGSEYIFLSCSFYNSTYKEFRIRKKLSFLSELNHHNDLQNRVVHISTRLSQFAIFMLLLTHCWHVGSFTPKAWNIGLISD